MLTLASNDPYSLEDEKKREHCHIRPGGLPGPDVMR